MLRGTFVPHISISREYLLTFVAIMGTTISPYLFFWQAAQNAEQDALIMRRIVGRPRRAVQRELRAAARDVNAGMLFSNLIMYFIILTAGATLHRAGITNVQTAEQAATALRPIAGNGAAWLFTRSGSVWTGPGRGLTPRGESGPRLLLSRRGESDGAGEDARGSRARDGR